MEDFIITPRDSETVQISVRIEKRIRDGLDKLSKDSGRTRNELINLSLDFALKHAKVIIDDKTQS